MELGQAPVHAASACMVLSPRRRVFAVLVADMQLLLFRLLLLRRERQMGTVRAAYVGLETTIRTICC